MNKLKKLYRDFFGLTEQTTTKPVDPTKVVHVKADVLNKNPKILDTLAKAGKQPEIVTEDDLEEAQLVNNITDYRGGVEYVLRDPAEAQSVASEIQEWAERKGFTVVKRTISKSGKVGYFYFRLGEDPARESQRIQGYIAQKPEIKHFRFNVRAQQQAPAINPKPNKFNQNELQ